ncbi:hypothetical protein [Nocardioides acrostichi]|uniref:Uncharacterized protein n=1 Tax=Nocardioides acrostichi TaxID=2784339 RepID=A0A930V454_9ACTN|nr:hypothetical protein [Nocardioides acrostichi]MBF4163380.1 hypothetical protein [Nocardioides acrostichi]
MSRPGATPPDDRWWDRQPRAVRMALPLVCGLVGWFAVRVGPDLFDDGSTAKYAYLAAVWIVLVVFLVVAVLRARRRLGGEGQLGLLRRALRTGEVPEGADREAWRRELARRVRAQQDMGIVVRVGDVVLLALTAAMVVLGVVLTITVSVGVGLGVVLTGLLLALTVWLAARFRRRRQERLRVLVDVL